MNFRIMAPRMGATTGATTTMAMTTARTVSRLRPSYMSLTMEVATASAAPPPKACSTLESTRATTLVDKAQPALPSRYRTSPISRMGLRPNFSLIGPQTRMPRAKKIRNRLRLRFTALWLALSTPIMCGSAGR